MARMKFLCDAERCIECNGCVTACKQEHDIPWGVNRRRVVTINDGVPGERSISVACMHCSDAPCMAVCPVDCFYRTDDGVVLHDKDLCIGCGYCFYACPFGAPQFPQAGAFGVRGKMDKCTFCAGGPEPEQLRGGVQEIRPQSPRRGQAAGVRRNVLDQGVDRRRRRRARGNLSDARDLAGQGSEVWGWATAYGRPEAPKQPGAAPARTGSRHAARRRVQIVIRRVDRHVGGRVGRGGSRRLRRAAAGRPLQAGEVPGQAGHGGVRVGAVERQQAGVGTGACDPQSEPERIQADSLTVAQEEW